MHNVSHFYCLRSLNLCIESLIVFSLIFQNQITYLDEQCLKYLKDIKWSKIDGSKGFKLDFNFKTNPFFGNSVLTKTYQMSDEDKSVVEEIKG